MMERCKTCQVPLSSLRSLGKDLHQHQSECCRWQNHNQRTRKACCKGIECSSSLLSHYQNYCHKILSLHLEMVGKTKSTCTFGKTCEETDVSKKRKHCVNGVSQKKLKPNKIESFPTITNNPSNLLVNVPSVRSGGTLLDREDSFKIKNSSIKFESSSCVSKDVTIEESFENRVRYSDSEDIFKSSSDENLDVIEPVVEKNTLKSVKEEERDVIELSNGEEETECDKYFSSVDGQTVHCDEKLIIDSKPFYRNEKLASPKNILGVTSPQGKKKQVSITSYFGNANSKVKELKLEFIEEEKKVSIKKNFTSPNKKSYLNNNINEQASTNETKKKQWNCPFYKKIPGTTFSVDAFCYGNVPGINHYFLSHFHYDHYRGLTKKFQGKIYCNNVTGNLITLKIGIPLSSLNILPMDKPVIIDGIEVKLLDANHCPGAAMFLFYLPNGQNILHTGDFRAHGKMQDYPDLTKRKIDTIYLDTTYLNASYTFPSQEDVVKFAISLSKQNLQSNPKTLFVCGSYTIGKEKVFLGIAEKLNCNIWAPKDKMRIFGCLENEALQRKLTQDPHMAGVHVLSMKDLNFKSLQEHLKKFGRTFNTILAIKPTGWEYQSGSSLSTLGNIKPKSYGPISIYGVPYSEHSSFDELKMFVKFLRPKRIIPTVSVGNPKKRNEMQEILNSWM